MAILQNLTDRTQNLCETNPETALRASVAIFKRGEEAWIFANAENGFPIIEGRAKILAPAFGEPNLFWCRFHGDRQTRLRPVFVGAWQKQPDQMLDELRTLWRASQRSERSVGDYLFPSDT